MKLKDYMVEKSDQISKFKMGETVTFKSKWTDFMGNKRERRIVDIMPYKIVNVILDKYNENNNEYQMVNLLFDLTHRVSAWEHELRYFDEIKSQLLKEYTNLMNKIKKI